MVVCPSEADSEVDTTTSEGGSRHASGEAAAALTVAGGAPPSPGRVIGDSLAGSRCAAGFSSPHPPLSLYPGHTACSLPGRSCQQGKCTAPHEHHTARVAAVVVPLPLSSS